jgi:hypothetical protein
MLLVVELLKPYGTALTAWCYLFKGCTQQPNLLISDSMKVRRAKYDDIRAMIDFMEAYHKTSNLKDIPFVRKDVARVLDHSIGRRDCLPLVALNDDDTVNGVLCVEVVPFFFNRKHYYVTDIMFISNGAGMPLLKKLKEWASSVGADKVIMAVSSGDPRADAFLELSGLEKTGNMYVLHR